MTTSAFSSTAHDRRVDVVNLEPQEDAVAIRPGIGISDRTVGVFDIPPVQLKDQRPLPDEALVFRATVIAPTAQQPLAPSAARLDIAYTNEGLMTHKELRRFSRQAESAAEYKCSTARPAGNCAPIILQARAAGRVRSSVTSGPLTTRSA